jgi:hypothetical protein
MAFSGRRSERPYLDQVLIFNVELLACTQFSIAQLLLNQVAEASGRR